MFKVVLMLFGMFVVCASIEGAAAGTALFAGLAPVFKAAAAAFLVAAVLYPVYDLWRLLTT